MDNKIFTVAIIGVGARGANSYGRNMMKCPDKFRIVSLCDVNEKRLSLYGQEFGVDESERFVHETDFFTKKRADLLVIATQDQDHVRQCIKAFELGYDVLLEKPITDKWEECERLLSAQKAYNRKALVCHVLRYAPAFVQAAQLIKDGAIGQLIAINALERVRYSHQAHSFVRGNWRNSQETTPMILQKCCHDLDLLQYYANSKCVSVSSIGELSYFTPDNAPVNSAARCVDCQLQNSCPYSAVRIYVERWKKAGSPADQWPHNTLVTAPTTEEKLMDVLSKGPYGRCVYRCDNNVVDHQLVNMTFENGVKASLTMTAFTADEGRRITFFGTLGEIVLEQQENAITLHKFGEEKKVLPIKTYQDGGYGHGGGDYFIIEDCYRMLSSGTQSETSLETSVESHLIGIAAEQSRLQGGKLVALHKSI